MDSRMNQFVRISRKNSRYFEYEDGTPFVPVGMNLCFERFSGDDAEILAIYRRWFRRFSENGGNFARIWLGVPFLNLEPEKPGAFSERKLENLRALVALGREYGIRLKFTLDHFRDPAAGPPGRDVPRGGLLPEPGLPAGKTAVSPTRWRSSSTGRRRGPISSANSSS